jgi:hypothetical protein
VADGAELSHSNYVHPLAPQDEVVSFLAVAETEKVEAPQHVEPPGGETGRARGASADRSKQGTRGSREA